MRVFFRACIITQQLLCVMRLFLAYQLGWAFFFHRVINIVVLLGVTNFWTMLSHSGGRVGSRQRLVGQEWIGGRWLGEATDGVAWHCSAWPRKGNMLLLRCIFDYKTTFWTSKVRHGVIRAMALVRIPRTLEGSSRCLSKGIESGDTHWIIIQIYRLIWFTLITASMLYVLIAGICLMIYAILIIPRMCLVVRLLGIEDGLSLLKLGHWLNN